MNVTQSEHPSSSENTYLMRGGVLWASADADTAGLSGVLDTAAAAVAAAAAGAAGAVGGAGRRFIVHIMRASAERRRLLRSAGISMGGCQVFRDARVYCD